jgi:hypothetical protein
VIGRSCPPTAPHALEVTLRSAEDGRLLAHGEDRNRGEPGPMSYLVRDGDRITLEDGWPTDDDLGRLVRLPRWRGRHPAHVVARR